MMENVSLSGLRLRLGDAGDFAIVGQAKCEPERRSLVHSYGPRQPPTPGDDQKNQSDDEK